MPDSYGALFPGPLFLLALSLPTIAQCDPQWQPGLPAGGLAGSAFSAALLPNGDLVAGGSFRVADAAFAHNVARWDGVTWHSMGSGVDGTVNAVAAMPNGDVVVGGMFLEAGGAPAARIARWDGNTWSPLGSGCNARVDSLLALPSGDLIAGGQFTQAGGVPCQRIARWDGSTWSPFGTGIASGSVYCLERLANGDLVAAGSFLNAGGVATNSVAVWNGTSWTARPGLDNGSTVFDIRSLTGGQFAIAGLLSIAAATTQVAVWNGTAFQALPVQPGVVDKVELLPNGDLVAGGYFAGLATGNVARWNGAAWSQIGAGAPGRAATLLVDGNGNLIAVGTPLGTGASAYNAVARYNGAGWTRLGAPRPPQIDAAVTMPEGGIVVGGDFAAIGGVAANGVARWRNGTWSALGQGVGGPVTALAAAADGSLVVAGEFQAAGGGPANRIARWSSGAWTSVGAGLPWAAHQVAAGAGGRLLARFETQLQSFDGQSWSSVTLPAAHNLVTIASAPEGDFVLGGLFATAAGTTGALRFDQGVLSATGPQQWLTLRFGKDIFGRVLAAVLTISGTELLRLQDNSWSTVGGPLPSGPPGSLSSLPNGDPIMLAGSGTSVVPVRFDGTNWVTMAAATVLLASPAPAADVLCDSDGNLVIAGEVLGVAGHVASALVIVAPTCPATVATTGTGCVGAGGPLTLAAGNLPWIGGTFESTASGFPAASLGVHVLGAPTVPVPLPIGAAGCSLFTTPDVLSVALPVNGAATIGFGVPRDVALAGVQVRTQVVGIELDAMGNLVRLTSTNALQLQVGAL